LLKPTVIKLVNAIEKIINAFLWGHCGTTRRGIHRLYWEKLVVQKNYGGMGFTDLTSFNASML